MDTTLRIDKLSAVCMHYESLTATRKDLCPAFVHEMPAQCKEGVLFMDTYSGTGVNNYLPGWRETGLRMIVRTPSYERGVALSFAIANLLRTERETRMGDLLVRQLLAVSDPHPYKSSAGGFLEFEVDLEMVYELPSG